MRNKILMATVASLSCAPARPATTVRYSLWAFAWPPPKTEQCTMTAGWTVPRADFRQWDGVADLDFRRVVRRGELVHAFDTTIAGQQLRVESTSRDGAWRLILMSPVQDTIELREDGRSLADGSPIFRGAWTCGVRFPFADDSTISPVGLVQLYP